MTSYDKYFNKSTKEIPLLYFLYFISIPFVKIFIKYDVKPMMITHLSVVSWIFSLFFLFFDFNYLFMLFLFLSLVFDICDGVVARLTDNSTALGSFYDHTVDIVKIILIYFIIALKLDSNSYWIIAFISISMFLFMGYLNQRFEFILSRIRTERVFRENESYEEYLSRYYPKDSNSTNKKSIFNIMYKSLFLIQGNFILYFLFFAYIPAVYPVSLWIIIVISFSIYDRIKNILQTVKYADKEKYKITVSAYSVKGKN